MNSNVIAMRPAEVDPLAEEVAELQSELNRLGAVDQRLAEAEAKAGEVKAALAVLDEAETEELRRWAESGKGALPPLLIGERKKLLERETEARAEIDAARNGVAAVEPRRAEILANLKRIARQARSARLVEVMGEAQRIHADAMTIVEGIREPLMRLRGLRAALARAVDRNDNESGYASEVGAAIGRLDGLGEVNVMADDRLADWFSQEWTARL